MNILVTGAAGFIGHGVIEELLERGHVITGIDCINSYYDPNLKYGRLQDLGIDKAKINGSESGTSIINSRKYENFRFVKGSIIDHDLMEKLFENGKYEKVINLAAQAGVRYSFENPYSYIQNNIVGYFNVLDLCRKFGIRHFIYASSSSIYGNCNNVPFKESERTDNPESIYAATKKSDELMARVYSSQLGLPTTGLRYFTVYGPWGRPDMAPFHFMKSVLEGRTIKVFNNGNLSRDFSYIADIVNATCKITEDDRFSQSAYSDKALCKVYNIGNSSPVKLMDFIGTIEKIAGRTAIKEFVGMQQGDVYRTYADTSEIEKDYGIKPSTSLEKGLKDFYKWYRDFYK
ncbi:MAG: NAD-dependent epimerase/dehydratase family protein [Bacteroidales bacterium]|jgi:UDP-glucuronate 4-epimerase|nr:NAD-dependent epimerase/dehydratase family protein [Bacteroidales bacterium]